jgi:hypothetical protein
MVIACRSLYIPQTGQAWWGRRGLWHCGHLVRLASVRLRWLRRFPWRDLGYFRFGSGGKVSLLAGRQARLAVS